MTAHVTPGRPRSSDDRATATGPRGGIGESAVGFAITTIVVVLTGPMWLMLWAVVCWATAIAAGSVESVLWIAFAVPAGFMLAILGLNVAAWHGARVGRDAARTVPELDEWQRRLNWARTGTAVILVAILFAVIVALGDVGS